MQVSDDSQFDIALVKTNFTRTFKQSQNERQNNLSSKRQSIVVKP